MGKKNLKGSVALAMVAVASVLLAGCSGGSGSAGSKTLTVQVQAGSEKEFAAFIKVFKEQNPGITVKTTSVSQQAKTGTNLQVLTSSSAPDVATIPTNTQVYTEMVKAKQLLPLNDVWKQANLAERYSPALVSALKTNDTPYVVSYDSTFYDIVYYNKKLFKTLGIAEPEQHRFSSLSALESTVSKLKTAGKQGLAIGPADNYQSSWLLDAFLPTSANESEMQNYLSSWQASTAVTAKYTTPSFTNALKQIQDMGVAGLFQDGFLGQKVSQAESLFLQGSAGMILDGNYSAAVFKSGGISFDYGWALLPSVNSGGKSQITQYNGNTLAIPLKAKNPGLARKFLESVMSVEGQSTVPGVGSLPAVNDVPASALSVFLPAVLEQLTDAKSNGGQPGWTSTVPGGLGQQLVDPLIQEMFNGRETPAEIGAAVQKQLDSIKAGQ
jgi:raffinose/stachyose/melibiose transport system substrate-binding protein